MNPTQSSTYDSTIAGAVDGSNSSFLLQPYSTTLNYVASFASCLLFRNGLLQDEQVDYVATPGKFTIPFLVSSEVITAVTYASVGPGKLRLDVGSVTVVGTQSLIMTPLIPSHIAAIPYLLFRNGQLLTLGSDYTVSREWILLVLGQAIQPGDAFFAVTGMGGTYCSTFDGSISGTIDGSNAAFSLPQSGQPVLFRNGQFLTLGNDYIQSGRTVTLLGAQIPQLGDVLTAVAYANGPTQLSSTDGTLQPITVSDAWIFFNGLLQTPSSDYTQAGNLVQMSYVPEPTGVVTAASLAIDPEEIDAPSLNIAKTYTSLDASLKWTLDGVNRLFTLPTNAAVTEILLFWNGVFQTAGTDYDLYVTMPYNNGLWLSAFIMTSAPASGDLLTVEVYLS